MSQREALSGAIGTLPVAAKQGVTVTADDGVATTGYRALLKLLPPASDDEVVGLLVKIPDTSWGVGQDYGEGNFIVALSDAGNFAAGASPPPITANISATTNATPVAVTTAAAHGFSTGDVVLIRGTGKAPLDNKWWKVTVTGASSFTLDNSTAPGSTASAGTAFTDRSPILFRVSDQGIGTMGLHVATGLRGRSGSALPGQAVWVQPSADIVSLVVDHYPNGINDDVQIRGSAGSKRLTVDAVQTLTFWNDNASAAPLALYSGTTPPYGMRAYFAAGSNGTVALVVRGNGGTQTADILKIDDGATTFFRFDKAGYPINKKTAAPADASLSAGEMAVWFDQTNGAAKLMVKAKSADGTVVTGQLALA